MFCVVVVLVYMFRIVTVARVHVFCCDGVTCTCFVLWQWHEYMLCVVMMLVFMIRIVTVARVRVWCCDDVSVHVSYYDSGTITCFVFWWCYVYAFLLWQCYVYMYCIVIVVCVHVLYCDSGKSVHVLYCDGGACACFVLWQWDTRKSLKNIALENHRKCYGCETSFFLIRLHNFVLV